MAQYHPDDEWLTGYASGAVNEQTSVLVATHLTYCPQCREEVARQEEIAGAMLDALEPEDAAAEICAREIAAPASRSVGAKGEAAPRGSFNAIAPAPLIQYVYEKTGTTDIDRLPWSFYGPGIERAILVEDKEGAIVRLFRAQPDAKFPDHEHGSDELTVVLTGAYSDHTGRYAVGDVQCAPKEISHRPVVEKGEICIALVVSEKPAVAKSFAVRMAQRILGR